MSEKILFVDDEPYVLESFKRDLGFRLPIDTASSAEDALTLVERDGPFAVVVADYRMPRMNGIQFLSRVMTISPDTVRIMLSGNADLQTAIDAVNEGQIFRFLTKPCSSQVIFRTLEIAIHQYRLVNVEKELLEKTLVESINMLTEVLSIVNPKAYGTSLRIREMVQYISRQMNINGSWQYEMAAALSQLGWIIFPPELLDKIAQNREFTVAESLLYSSHPFTARKLLEKIPRLELIAQIIEGQNRSIEDLCLEENGGQRYFVDLGSHILNVCVEYDKLLLGGLSHSAAVRVMDSSGRKYSREVLDVLKTLKASTVVPSTRPVEAVTIDDLDVGMILAEPLCDYDGSVVFDQNTLITRSVLVQIYKVTCRPDYILGRIQVIRPE